MALVRLIGFVAAAVAAVAVFILAGPDDARRFTPIAVAGNQELIDEAVAAYEADAAVAGDDIALQELANGWIARDLLFINAGQLDALSEQVAVLSAQTVANAQGGEPDDRVPGLLLVAVLTLAFHFATAGPVAPVAARAQVSGESSVGTLDPADDAPDDPEPGSEIDDEDPEA